jgi:DNA uptake protein ComE-like DNA-binding protein
LNDSNSSISGDGRLTVVLSLLFGLLFLDLTHSYHCFLFTEQRKNNLCEQLHFMGPDKLVVENCLEEGRGRVPAGFTPFFFKLIPINSADKDMLMTVKGIGPALADTIVLYRHQFGPFTNSLDLQNLHRVGPKRAAELTTAFTFIEEP